MKHNLFKTLALICVLAIHAGAQTEGAAVWTGDEQKLYNYLKAQGAPDDIVLAVMFARDRHEIEDQRIGILFPKGMTRWAGRPRTEIAQLHEVYDQRRIKLRAIMGDRLDITLVKNDAITRAKWGDLTDTEIVNVKRVHEAYDSIMVHNRPYNGTLNRVVFDWDHQFNAAFEKDIRRVLGAKADDFLTFNSPLARKVQADLSDAGVEVDEPTFRRLLEETRALRLGLVGKIKEMTTSATRLKEMQMYHVVLGAANALAMASEQDVNFSRLNSLTEGEPGLRLQFYFEYLEGIDRLSSVSTEDPLNPSPEALAQMREEKSKLFALIQANVPRTKLLAFMQTREGRYLETWK